MWLKILAILIVILIALKIICKLMFIRIHKFLTVNRFNNEINQSVKKKFKNCLTNNFTRERVEELVNEIKNTKDFLEEYFKKTNIEKFKTKTNSTMHKQLVKIENKGYITIIELGETELKKQPLERIIIMGFYTTIINLFNKRYWKYIFNTVKHGKYEIIVNNSLKKEKSLFKNIICFIGIVIVILLCARIIAWVFINL